MARPIWKGFLSFGLVNVPCAMSSLTAAEADLDFKMLDGRDEAAIKYLRVNERTGKEVPWKEIVKGHEVSDGKFVIVTPEDFRKAAPKASRTIEITGFVAQEEIDPRFFEKPYVLHPGADAAKGYALLCTALREAKKVGIARMVLHTREHLCAVIADGDTLLLNTLRFAEELRDPVEVVGADDAKDAPKVNKREVDVAKMLIDGMTVAWEPKQYHDQYRDTLRKWIEAKAKKGGKKIETDDDDEPPPEGPFNMMELLKKSLEARKKAPARGREVAREREAQPDREPAAKRLTKRRRVG